MSKISEEQKEKAQQLRDKLANDFDEKEAKEFASTNEDKKWYSDFILLFDMLNEKDFHLSQKSKLLIMGTLAYIILPVDIIPDFIPIVGWLDDVFILGLTINSLHDEIQRYKKRYKST